MSYIVAQSQFSEVKRSAKNETQVYGNDGTSVSRVYKLLGDVRSFLHREVAFPTVEPQDLPQGLIYLYGNEGDPLPENNYTLQLVEVLGETKIRLNVHLGAGINTDRLTQRMVEMNFLSWYYHEAPNLDSYEMSSWLSVGVHEWYLRSRGRLDSELYKVEQHGYRYFSSDILQSVRNPQSLDVQAFKQFRAAAGALVMLLKDKDSKALRKVWSASLNFDGDLMSLLSEHYPSLLLTKNGLQKWWLLSAEGVSREMISGMLSMLETRARVMQILTSQFPLEVKRTQLIELSPVAFVLYRQPLQRLIQSIDDKGDGYNLGEITELNQRAREAAVHLDWVVVNQGSYHSSQVEQLLYERAQQRKSSPKRRDWLRKVLDEAQSAFLNNRPIEIEPFQKR